MRMGVVTTQAVVRVFYREGFDYPQQVIESCLAGIVKQLRECYYQRMITIDLITEGATIFDEIPHPLHLVGVDVSPRYLCTRRLGPTIRSAICARRRLTSGGGDAEDFLISKAQRWSSVFGMST